MDKLLYIGIDFESFYSQEYSLKKMTPPEYLLSPLFRSHGASVVLGDEGVPQYLEHEQLVQFFERVRALPFNVAWVSHNALFDMCLMHWKYGFMPKLMIDTLGMSRTLLGHILRSHSLESVARYLKLPPKGGFLKSVIGMSLEQIKAAGLWGGYTSYANHDNWLCREIFKILRKDFPFSEFRIMHSVLECAVKPRFIVDEMMLAQHKNDLEVEKEELLQRCGLADRTELMSNDKFADLLRSVGVEPETKISLKTNKEAYAFAKTDPFMVELDEHPDPFVQALAAARVGHKSTQEETRTARFIAVSRVDNRNAAPGVYPARGFPIPLRYGAAHTSRLGGDWKLNTQNLQRTFRRPGILPMPGKLRSSLRAPPGFKVVAVDSSQIEARINAVINQELWLVEAYRQGRDIYCEFGSEEIYHRVITKRDKIERWLAKKAVLGLGYQMGWPKFSTTVRGDSYIEMGQTIMLPDEEYARIVGAYRRRNANISGSWAKLKGYLPLLASHNSGIQYGPVTFGYREITGPTGLKLYYKDLEQRVIGGESKWVFNYAETPKFIYGGKLLENIVQFLARLIVMEAGERIRDITQVGYAAQVHDELVYVIHESEVDQFCPIIMNEMNRTPIYMPTLPLASESKVGDNYGYMEEWKAAA